jgi:uncharacterized protein (TIRG00374 family)
LKKALWLSVNIAISVFFIWLAVRGVDFSDVGRSLIGVSFSFVVLSVAVNFLSCWLRALRWQYLLAPTKKVRVHSLFSALLIGLMVNNILPFRLGELMRGYAVKQSEDVSFSASMGTVVVERIIDVLTLLIIFGSLIFFFPFPEWVKSGGILVGLIIAAAIVVLYLLTKKSDWALDMLDRGIAPFSKGLSERLQTIARAFIGGISFLHSARAYAIITVLSFLIWAAYVYCIFAIFHACHFDATYHLDSADAVVVMVFTAFAVMIPAAPGYVGTFHELAKQSLIILHVDKENALGMAILLHATQYISITAVGFCYFFKSNLHFRDVLKGKPAEVIG